MRERAALPGFVPPELPTLAAMPPQGDGWIHEIKFDGWRLQVVIDGPSVRAFTKNGHDWSDRFAPIVQAAGKLGLKSAVIDGEVVTTDEEDRISFSRLRHAISNSPDRLIFVAFDLLYVDGHDIRRMGAEERRHILRDVIETGGRIQLSEELEGDAADLFSRVQKAGLEGMVSKRRDSPYRSGPSRDWLKAKCYDVAELEIAGVKREKGKPAMVFMADKGRYVGSAFVTLNNQMRTRLWERVKAKAGGRPPSGVDVSKADWLKPGMVGRVKFLRGEEKLRHASLQAYSEPTGGRMSKKGGDDRP